MKVANHSSHPELLQSHFSTRKPDLSRRRFLLLAGVGLLAGCSPFSQSPPLPTATPRPRLQRITAENASRLKQVHLLDLQASVHGLAWSPDGHLLAVAPSNQIDLWAVETMNHLLTLKGHTARINGLAWSPDNSLLASVSTDGTTHVWNTKQWQSTATLKHTAQGGSFESILSAAWSPDGHQLITGNADGTLELWEVKTSKNLGKWHGLKEETPLSGSYPFGVWGVAWSPDGQRIASNRYDKYTFVWAAHTGKLVKTLIPSDQPNGAAYSPDGKLLAITNDGGTVQLWSPTGKNMQVLSGHPEAGWAYPIVWSPDGNLLATTRESGLLQLWEVKTGKELAALQDHTGAAWTATWSPDGKQLATGGDDTSVHLWAVL